MNSEESKQENNEEGLFEHYRFNVDPGQVPVRIDKFLMDRIANTSRNKIQIAAKNGSILVDNKVVKQNYKIKPNDLISIVLPYPVRNIELIPENIPLNIHYEDEEVILVNKPTNMVVHPGYANYTGTLINALLFHFENLPKHNEYEHGRPGLVHRIDKNTSGLLVIAKTENALSHLAKQFFDHSIERKYYALVWGDIEDAGTIEGHIGRSLKNRKVMTVFPNADYGKYAITHYKPIQRFGLVTLIECELETGRTHQIRVHLKYIGHPLFNDLEYGGDKIIKGGGAQSYKKFINNCFSLLDGQALHAKSLGFYHPKTNEKVHFESKLPDSWVELLKKWNNYTSDMRN